MIMGVGQWILYILYYNAFFELLIVEDLHKDCVKFIIIFSFYCDKFFRRFPVNDIWSQGEKNTKRFGCAFRK